jgi:hypothetical protein
VDGASSSGDRVRPQRYGSSDTIFVLAELYE